MKTNVNNMTKKDFIGLPHRAWDEEIICNSIVIIPMSGRKGDLHGSGFRCMDFVAVHHNEPLCLLSGCSDVIHINGIGGLGEYRREAGIPHLIEPLGWSIDCLPKSGLLHLFSPGRLLKCGDALSGFEVFAHTTTPEEP